MQSIFLKNPMSATMTHTAAGGRYRWRDTARVSAICSDVGGGGRGTCPRRVFSYYKTDLVVHLPRGGVLFIARPCAIIVVTISFLYHNNGIYIYICMLESGHDNGRKSNENTSVLKEWELRRMRNVGSCRSPLGFRQYRVKVMSRDRINAKKTKTVWKQAQTTCGMGLKKGKLSSIRFRF